MNLSHLAIGLAFLMLSPHAYAKQNSVQESPEEYYKGIRKAVVATKPELRESAIDWDAVASDMSNFFVILDCNSPIEGEFGQEMDDPDIFPTHVARDVEQASATLRAGRVPIEVWGGYIDTINRLAVEYLKALRQNPSRKSALSEQAYTSKERVEAEFEAALNRYGKSRGQQFYLREGCGAGEVPVVIRTRPADAAVAYIPLFKYKLCEARQLSPLDAKVCNGWVNAVKKEEYLSGKYFYIAKWADGGRTSGVFNVNDSFDPSVEENIQVMITRNH